MKERTADDKVQAVFLHWSQTFKKPRARCDEKRFKKISSALRCGYTVEDLCTAINGCHSSRWHMGENDRRRPYISIELIFRDADHIDDFMARVPTKKTQHGIFDQPAKKLVTMTATFDPSIKNEALKSLRKIAGVRRRDD